MAGPVEPTNSEGEAVSSVVHLTEALVRKALPAGDRETPLSQIRVLCLNARRTHPYGKIETCTGPVLSLMPALESLDLSQNSLRRLDGVGTALRRLTELNLSDNQISHAASLCSLPCASSLTRLNLAGNSIARLPEVMSVLVSLQSLRLDRNRLSVLGDLRRLSPLQSLTSLTLRDNPLAAVPHYRVHSAAAIPSLDMLDGVSITDEHRREGRDRFANGEALDIIDAQQASVNAANVLQMRAEAAENEVQTLQKCLEEEKRQRVVVEAQRKRLATEIDVAEQLLRSQNAEITALRSEVSSLGQKLAFMSIDGDDAQQHREEGVDGVQYTTTVTSVGYEYLAELDKLVCEGISQLEGVLLAAVKASDVVSAVSGLKSFGEDISRRLSECPRTTTTHHNSHLSNTNADKVVDRTAKLLEDAERAAGAAREARLIAAQAEQERSSVLAELATARKDLSAVREDVANAEEKLLQLQHAALLESSLHDKHRDKRLADALAAEKARDAAVAERDAAVRELTSAKETCSTEVESARAVVSDLRKEASRWEEAVDNARLILAREEERRKQAAKTAALTAEKSMNAIEENLRKKKELVLQEQAVLDSLQARKSGLEIAIGELHDTAHDLSQDLANQKAAFDQQKSQLSEEVKDIESALRDRQHAKERLNTVLADTEKRLHEMEARIAQLRVEESRLSEYVTREAQERERELSTWQARIRDAKTDADTLATRIEERTDQLRVLEGEIASQSAAYRRLRDEHESEHRLAAEKLTSIKNETEVARTRAAAASSAAKAAVHMAEEAKNRAMEATLKGQAAMSLRVDAETAQMEAIAAKESAQTARAEIDLVRTELATCRRALEAASAEQRMHAVRGEELRRKISQAKETEARILAETAALRSEAATLKQAVVAARADQDDAQASTDVEMADLERLRDRTAAAMVEYRRASDQLARTKEAAASQARALETLRHEVNEERKKLLDTQRAASMAKAAANEASEMQKAAKRSADELSQHAQSIEAQTTAAEDRKTAASVAVLSLEARAEQAKKSVAVAEAARREALNAANIATMKAKEAEAAAINKAQLSAEVASLTAVRDALKHEVTRLQNEATNTSTRVTENYTQLAHNVRDLEHTSTALHTAETLRHKAERDLLVLDRAHSSVLGSKNIANAGVTPDDLMRTSSSAINNHMRESYSKDTRESRINGDYIGTTNSVNISGSHRVPREHRVDQEIGSFATPAHENNTRNSTRSNVYIQKAAVPSLKSVSNWPPVNEEDPHQHAAYSNYTNDTNNAGSSTKAPSNGADTSLLGRLSELQALLREQTAESPKSVPEIRSRTVIPPELDQSFERKTALFDEVNRVKSARIKELERRLQEL